MAEGRRLQKIGRTAKDPIKLRRAIVVLMSAQGQSVQDITSLMPVSDDYVRNVLQAFNEQGSEALHPKWNGGRPKAEIAGFSAWSLAKLAEHLIAQKIVPRDTASDPA